MSELDKIKSILCCAGPTFDGGSEESRSEIAKEWLDYGFAAEGVAEWVAAECWDCGSAYELMNAGFRPNKDELNYRYGSLSGSPMYDFCNADISLDDLTW